ncbi:MAG: hypothetical protein M3Z26_06160 [Bacteroidota bacterium]|nr:hypothetical protein [Bacteroidota bacterium]
MTTLTIRRKLSDYMKVADDKKVKAVYALLKDEMEEDELEYSEDFKKELERRYAYYKSGGKMVSAVEAEKQISDILQSPAISK